MATYSDILRAKKDAEGLRAKSERFRGLAESAGPNVTSGGMVQGMGGASSPTAQNVDWGNIIQKGIGNYQAASAGKQADAKDEQADQMNEMFMKESLGSDPEAQRLMQMAQAGIPGAEQALSERIAPKKEALGAFLQHLQSGVADPAMVAELAPRYGLSPEIATKAAETALARQAQAEQLKHQQAIELAGMRRPVGGGGGGGGGSRSSTVSFQEYASMTPEQQEAYNKFKGRKGSSTEGGLTPGERNVRAKELVESQDKIRLGSQNVSAGEAMRKYMYDDETFGFKQKLAQVMAQSDVPVVGGALAAVGQGMRSPGAAMLESYINSEVLDRMAMLGGNDSNEELRQMRMTLPSVLNDPQAARELYEKLLAWQRRKLQEEKDYQARVQSNQFFETGPRVEGGPSVPSNTSPLVPELLAPMGQQAPAKPAAGKIEILEILD